jgi:hypothetical protein
LNLTKGTLADRSFINQVKYSPKMQSIAIVGTNDGNVQIGFNLGTGVANQANWVNVTGGNAILPNRPVLGIALDPTTTSAPIGYAAVGGFDENSPSTPGHVFRVVCDANCVHSTWTNKSGNLPNIPVDSVIANPNFPMQVYAGTDFGLYYTDDITAATPVWYRFNNGLPNVMVWDMQIDRGATTLSLWTRSRGAYVWPLPSGPESPLPTVVEGASVTGTFGGTVTLSATLTSGGNPVSGETVTFALNGNSAGNAVSDANGVATLNAASLASINAGAYPGGDVASFAGDNIYAANASSADLTVNKADQTIAFGALANKTFGDSDFSLSAAASSGLSVSFTVSGQCAIAGSTVHITGAGSCTATASQGGDGNYNPAPAVPQSFSINMANQDINFPAIPNHTVGDAPFSISATASSGLPITFALLSGPATLNGNLVTLNGGVGKVTVEAADTGNVNYNPAANVDQSFEVSFALCPLYSTTKLNSLGSTVPLKLTLCSTSGINLSSPATTVRSVQLVNPLTGAVVVPVDDSGNANPGGFFRFDPTLAAGGGYIFNLSTKNLATGTWRLVVMATGDNVAHPLPLQLR